MSDKPITLEHWCSRFAATFAFKNRHQDWSYFIAMLARHLGLVVSPKYYRGNTDFPRHYSKSLAWLIGLHNRYAKREDPRSAFGESRRLSRLLLNEIPLVCPFCMKPECNEDPETHKSSIRVTNRRLLQNAAAELIRKKGEEKATGFSLDSWAKKILTIYPRNGDATLEMLACKISEEMAELISSLKEWRRSNTPRSRADYFEEVSDLFSRLCVFGRRVIDSGHPQITPLIPPIKTVDDLVWCIFKDGCPDCAEWREGDECQCGRSGEAALFGDLYGPDKEPPPPVLFDIAINIGDTNWFIKIEKHFFNLQTLAIEDRTAAPTLPDLVRELNRQIHDDQVVPSDVLDTVRKLADTVPPDRKRGYGEALTQLLAGIAGSTLAQKLQPVMNELTELIKELLRSGS